MPTARFGRDTEGYLLTMTPRDGSAPARFHKAFGSPDATSDITPEHNPALFRFGLWTMFNIAALERRAVAVHSSVISLDGAPYSSSANRARERAPTRACGASISPGHACSTTTARSSGSPRKGLPKRQALPRQIRFPPCKAFSPAGRPVERQTPCYRNVSHPIAGIVRLSQAPQNRIRRLRPIEAIGALLPSCPPSFAHDERLEDAICRLVSQIVAQVPVYHLECLPDAAAARLSCRTVFGDDAPNTLR